MTVADVQHNLKCINSCISAQNPDAQEVDELNISTEMKLPRSECFLSNGWFSSFPCCSFRKLMLTLAVFSQIACITRNG